MKTDAGQRSVKELTRILRIARAMTAEKDLDKLLALIVRETTQLVDAERSSLFLIDEEAKELYARFAEGEETREIRFPMDKGIAGHVATTGEIVHIPDAYADDRFNPEVDKATGFKTRNILCCPLVTHEDRIIGVVQVLNKNGGPFARRDEQLLLAMGSYAAVVLDNARLVEHYVEKKRLEQSLSIAREIQEGFYPNRGMEVGSLYIRGWHRTSEATGGDYYDFFAMPDGRLGIVVGDVSGHGIGPALLMASTRATLRGLAKGISEPDVVLNQLNTQVCNDAGEGRFVTLFYGIVDPINGEMMYASAGHDPPLLFDPEGGVSELDSSGVPLGILDDEVYERMGPIQIDPSGVLVMGTDGMWEAANAEEEAFGRERLIDSVRARTGNDAEFILDGVVSDFETFLDGVAPHDDLTLIALVRQPRRGPLGTGWEPHAPEFDGKTALERSFLSTSGAKNVVLEEVLDTLGTIGEDRDDPKLRLLFDEALVNAMEHGNQWDETKSVQVKVALRDRAWAMWVQDEGAGFEPDDVPDPLSEEGLERESGRGILLMQAICDRVIYFDGGRGLYIDRTRRSE